MRQTIKRGKHSPISLSTGRVRLWVLALLAFFLLAGVQTAGFTECSKTFIRPSEVSAQKKAVDISELKVFPSAIDPADIKLEETMTASFRQRFKAVLMDAQNYLKTSYLDQNPESHGAVVFDLDETVLDNRAYFIIHKRYDPTLWNQWMTRGEAPILPESLEFIHWVQKQGLRVYFVTGRPERFRDVTVQNLNRVGISCFDGLYMKPDVYGHQSARHFKIEARADIENKGYPVWIILGDQESDLRGGHGVGFKLPNPIYFIP